MRPILRKRMPQMRTNVLDRPGPRRAARPERHARDRPGTLIERVRVRVNEYHRHQRVAEERASCKEEERFGSATPFSRGDNANRH